MKPIDPKVEQKILRDIVAQMKDVAATERKQSRTRKTMLILGAVGQTFAFFLAINQLVLPFFIAVIAAISGTLIGFSLLLENTLKLWPVTRRHIDMKSVRKRLEELGASGD